LNLTGNTSLECNQLCALETQLGAGVITHPASCLGEGELVFSVINPDKPDTNHNDDLELAALHAKLSELSKSKPVTNLESDAQNAKTVSLALTSKLNINLSEDELLRELNSEKTLGCKFKEEH